MAFSLSKFKSFKQLKFQFYAHGPKHVFLFIWLALNIFLFAYDYYNYNTRAKFTYIRQVMGAGLPLARGSAACLNLNCGLIILCVCRNLLSIIHNWKYCPRVVRRLINHNLALHKLCAWSIVFHTVLHTLAHLYNVEFTISYFKNEEAVRFSDGTTIPLSSSTSNSLPVDNSYTVYQVLFATWGGLTGLILDLVLFIMVTSSIKIIRRSYFEVFWFTHHLFVLFFASLIIHSVGQMIKSQSNVVCQGDMCSSECAYIRAKGNNTAYLNFCNDNEPVTFAGPGFTNWSKPYFWVGIPFIIYAIDRILRWSQRFKPATVFKAIQHEGNCLELRMRKEGWKQEAGQYVFLQCSEISLFEWHPFTLTSAPEENYLSVNIRLVGDWTRQLGSLIRKHSNKKTTKKGINTELQFQLAVDGPYGTPSDDIFKYDVSVCIGAGVGCTPYCSILKSVWYKLKSGNHQFGCKKMYFYWVVSDEKVFAWFADVLKLIVEELNKIGAGDFLEIRPYLTRFSNRDLIENVALTADESVDNITKIPGHKTNFGRPKWRDDFIDIGTKNAGKDIGIFFCGPAMLSEALDKASTEANTKLENENLGSMFFYNKENF